MQIVTAIIALFATVIMWRGTPLRALCVYFVVILMYPQFLTLKLGVADFNTMRILILILFVKLALQTRLIQEMKWTNLDRLVVIGFVTHVMVVLTHAAPSNVLEHESGYALSVLFPYFAIRAIVRSREDFHALVRSLIAAGLVLAVLGIYESLSGHNPMGFMKGYNAWAPSEQRTLSRFGLVRADVSFGQYIAFGLFFAMMLPLAIMENRNSLHPLRTLVVLGLLFGGLVSSMSTAPFLAFLVVVMIFFWFPFRMYTPLAIAILFGAIVFLELYSNRHFYEVMTRVAMDSKTASYRIGLVNEAFGGGMDGHWLSGYGYVGIGPGNDNTHFNWKYTDLVNIYISRLARTGLIGLTPFLLMNMTYYVYLRRAWRAATSPDDRWMIWCLMAGLVGWNVAMMTVGTVSLLSTLLYSMIALVGAIYAWTMEESMEKFVDGEESTEIVVRKVPGKVYLDV